MYKQSHNRIQPQSKPEVNIYQELSQLPTKIADKITNAKTGGGRSLNAIHASKTLSQLEKHLLLVLGSQMNFCQEFANQYRYISLNDLAEKLSVNQRTVSGILNGMKRKTGYVPGLIEKGYVKKLIPTKPEQLEKHWKTDYCITSKIFDEYLILCIEREKALIAEEERKRGSEKPLPSDLGSEDPLILDQRTSDPRSDKIPLYAPSYNSPSILNAAGAQQPASKKILKEPEKRVRPPSKRKMKTWEDKSEDEKMDTLLNKSVDAHRLAVDRKRARPKPFDDFPDILGPIIEKYGVSLVKEFFDLLEKENLGCDIRCLNGSLGDFKQRKKHAFKDAEE